MFKFELLILGLLFSIICCQSTAQRRTYATLLFTGSKFPSIDLTGSTPTRLLQTNTKSTRSTNPTRFSTQSKTKYPFTGPDLTGSTIVFRPFNTK